MGVHGVLIQEPQITWHVCIQCSKLIKSLLMAAFALWNYTSVVGEWPIVVSQCSFFPSVIHVPHSFHNLVFFSTLIKSHNCIVTSSPSCFFFFFQELEIEWRLVVVVSNVHMWLISFGIMINIWVISQHTDIKKWRRWSEHLSFSSLRSLFIIEY